jgi:iron complex outermembrane receptor protein
MRGFSIGPTVERVGKRWADFENSYRVDSHTLLGLRAGWENERWRAFADIRNLTDEQYVAYHSVRNVASADDAVLYAGEPLSAYFGFEVSFD